MSTGNIGQGYIFYQIIHSWGDKTDKRRVKIYEKEIAEGKNNQEKEILKFFFFFFEYYLMINQLIV